MGVPRSKGPREVQQPPASTSSNGDKLQAHVDRWDNDIERCPKWRRRRDTVLLRQPILNGNEAPGGGTERYRVEHWESSQDNQILNEQHF